MRRSQNLEIVFFSVKKQLHKVLRLVQILASFTSFYFEILSYLACGENIIRLASKNSVKLDPKQLVICSLYDMLQDTPFLLSLYMLIIIREVLQ